MIGILSVTRWNSSSVTDRQQLAATLRAQRYRRGRGGRKGGEDRGREEEATSSVNVIDILHT